MTFQRCPSPSPQNLYTCYCTWQKILEDVIEDLRDFPGSSVVKTSSFNAGGADSIPDRGASIPGWGASIPHASWPKY